MIETFDTLNAQLDSLPRKRSTFLLGIDGLGGSGKSVFAQALKRNRADVTVVQMDDFFLPSSQRPLNDPYTKPIGGDFDWQRIYEQVLVPLSQNKEGRYQRYDWGSDTLAEEHTVVPGGMVIVEGVYSTRNELASIYDFKVWVECPRDVRLARGLARDGEEAREVWENDWMVAEDRYVEAHRSHRRADLVIDSSGKLDYDPAHQFVYFM
ncbi:MAG: uridine kinase [Chloroflexota bacterium]|nr:uridine kinase [Chloroflexota bacterium]